MSNGCQRCGKQMVAWTMSRFNTQLICLPCVDKEKAHPKYAEGAAAELAAVKAGNFHFPGIGLPGDLDGIH